MNKLKLKAQVRKEIHKLPNLADYKQDTPAPQADAAMIRYLLDSIAWLDSLEED